MVFQGIYSSKFIHKPPHLTVSLFIAFRIQDLDDVVLEKRGSICSLGLEVIILSFAISVWAFHFFTQFSWGQPSSGIGRHLLSRALRRSQQSGLRAIDSGHVLQDRFVVPVLRDEDGIRYDPGCLPRSSECLLVSSWIAPSVPSMIG